MSSTKEATKRILGLNGVFAVAKPSGETSAKTVSRVKAAIISSLSKREQKFMERKVKVGHGGTLDPMASGVLVIGLGTGCKALSSFLSGTKAYRAVGRFGQSFDTLDCTGVPTGRTDVMPERESFDALLQAEFVGDVMQRPPAFSAVRINGERAYALARRQQQAAAGQEADTNQAEKEASGQSTGNNDEATPSLPLLEARKVHIERVSLLEWSLPQFSLEVECGGGTYIRSIIDESARAAGSLAAMYALERIKQGSFGLQDCIQVEECADLDLLNRTLSASASLLEKK